MQAECIAGLLLAHQRPAPLVIRLAKVAHISCPNMCYHAIEHSFAICGQRDAPAAERAAVKTIERTILGIDPGLAHTGWGLVRQEGPRLSCVAYGCTETDASADLASRLLKIHDQIAAVIDRFGPTCVGIETVWFGQNITAAFATGQARGAALVACAAAGLQVGEFTPNQIKLTVVGEGHAEKEQVQYMVRHALGLEQVPRPDHAADALAAAICYSAQTKASTYDRLAAAAASTRGKGLRA